MSMTFFNYANFNEYLLGSESDLKVFLRIFYEPETRSNDSPPSPTHEQIIAAKELCEKAVLKLERMSKEYGPSV